MCGRISSSYVHSASTDVNGNGQRNPWRYPTSTRCDHAVWVVGAGQGRSTRATSTAVPCPPRRHAPRRATSTHRRAPPRRAARHHLDATPHALRSTLCRSNGTTVFGHGRRPAGTHAQAQAAGTVRRVRSNPRRRYRAPVTALDMAGATPGRPRGRAPGVGGWGRDGNRECGRKTWLVFFLSVAINRVKPTIAINSH
jgi:hypothetical protein